MRTFLSRHTMQNVDTLYDRTTTPVMDVLKALSPHCLSFGSCTSVLHVNGHITHTFSLSILGIAMSLFALFVRDNEGVECYTRYSTDL